MEYDRTSFIEAILHDALNIYDVVYWAEQAGHRLLTQRKEMMAHCGCSSSHTQTATTDSESRL